MDRSLHSARARAGAAAALLLATGLVLTACGGGSSGGNSNTGSSNTGNSNTGSSNTGNSNSPSASNSTSSSNSGGGSTSTTSSNSVPFPIGTGNTWVYTSAVSLTGTKTTVTDKMTSVTPVPGGQEVKMANTINGQATHSVYIFHSDGSITYPFNQLGNSVTVVSGSIQWPPASVIASGQPTHSSLKMALLEGTKKVDVNTQIVVKGEGTVSVTVPAGTYSATIVSMTETFSVLGHNETIDVKTWVANGVGPVKSEAIINLAGTSDIVSDQSLVSFTKG
jgi:hypothetical protein